MGSYTARVFRALLISTAGFGGGCMLLIFIIVLALKGNFHALEYALKAGLIAGGIFAAFQAIILLPLDIASRLFLAKEPSEGLWELTQQRQLEFSGSLKSAMAISRRALLELPYTKSVSEDIDNLVLSASIGPSWKSSGEEVKVKIEKVAENKWRIYCISTPASKNTVFDYGKNFENVEFWMKIVSTHISNNPIAV